jgi:hypothetical protein
MVRKYNYEDRPKCDYKDCNKKIDALDDGFGYCSKHYIMIKENPKTRKTSVADTQIRSSY